MMPELTETFDACITDLPYGTTQNKWDSIIPFELMWRELSRLVKDNGVKIFTSSQPFTSLLICSNLHNFKHEWIWQKNRGSNFANTVREPFKEHEEVIVFCDKGNWTYNKQMQERAESVRKMIGSKMNFITSTANYGKFKGI